MTERLAFGTLSITDFKTFRGEHVIRFDQFGAGVHYVKGRNGVNKRLGSNGAGKSSIWDAIVWCLFGETVEGLKNPDVRPWDMTKGPTRVGITFTHGKQAHSVLRTISPNRLTMDRRDVGQADVIKALGVSHSIFINAIILGQGRELFYDREPREKMQIFVEALNLDRWDDRAKAASARVAELDLRVAEMNGRNELLLGNIEQFKGMVDDARGKADAWDQEYEDRKASQEKEIKTLAAQYEVAEKGRGKADLAYEGASIDSRHCAQEFQKAAERLQDAERSFKVSQDRMKALAGKILHHRERLKELGEGDKCDRCGQALKGTSLIKHRKEIRATIDELEEMHEAGIPKPVLEEYDDAQAYLAKTRLDMNAFLKKADEARDNLDTYTKKASELKARLDVLKANAERKDEEINPHRAQLRKLKKMIADAEQELKELTNDIRVSMRKQERAKYWVKGFKDIRLFVLEEVLQELEAATNAMLDEAGLVGWRVAYLMERETARGTVRQALEIMIKSPQSRGMVKWKSWSGGERQRLRVIGALALSEVLLNHAGIDTGVEVLDEPTTHLSAEGVQDICEYLADRAKRLKRSIFYCDHQSVASTRFRSVVTVNRTKAGSRVEIQAN